MLINIKKIHGVGVMNSIILNSKISKYFDLNYVSYIFSESQAELGKINIKKIKNLIKIIFNLTKILHKNKVDLVYRPIAIKGLAFIRDSLVLIYVNKIFRISYVLHIHGRGIKESYQSSNLIIKYLYKWVFGNASGIIVLGKRLVDDVSFLTTNDKIYIVSNGVPDIECINNRNINSKYKLVLFLANMKEDKGPLILLNSALNVLAKNKNVKFIFVGHWRDDNVKKAFQKLSEDKKYKDDIIYLGPKYGEEKIKIMCKSNIFAYPTSNDAFPLVILEAMAAGLPVISTTVGAIPEIVINGETGFLIPPKDPNALAEKIIYLLDNPEIAKKMGENGRKRFEELFTVEKFEKRMIKVFNDIFKEVEKNER